MKIGNITGCTQHEDRLREAANGAKTLALWAPTVRAAMGHGEAVAGKTEGRRSGVAHTNRRKQPNKTELDYRRRYIDPLLKAGIMTSCHYEALTFRLAAGFSYTPDWVCRYPSRLVLIEVKGGYRFGSHNRAQVAWKPARAEWPEFEWVWAEKKNGEWTLDDMQEGKA
jgi:hypothetical protein